MALTKWKVALLSQVTWQIVSCRSWASGQLPTVGKVGKVGAGKSEIFFTGNNVIIEQH